MENRRITKHGWIDFTDLEKTSDGRVNWIKSVGKTFSFEYDGTKGSGLIVQVPNGQKVEVKFLETGQIEKIYKSYLIKGEIGQSINRRVSGYRFVPGDIVNGLEIIKSYYKKSGASNRKTYLARCTIDGYEREIVETKLMIGRGCPVCSGRKAMAGVNDLATIHPDVAELFLNPSEAIGLPDQVNDYRTMFKCPNCSYVTSKAVADVVRQGYSCPRCSDGLSYPNKFIVSLLLQLNNSGVVRTEKWFSWSDNIYVPWQKNPKRMIYDVYLPEHSIIIENHGIQHYKQSGFKGHNLEDEIENDRIKQEIAIRQGMHYIVLDCRESTLEYVKTSIMNSQLPSLLEFNEDKIDWIECDIFASGSLLLKVCELYKSGMTKSGDISKKVMLSEETVLRYIKKGKKLGIIPEDSNLTKYLKNNRFRKEFLATCKEYNNGVEDVEELARLSSCSVDAILHRISKGRELGLISQSA